VRAAGKKNHGSSNSSSSSSGDGEHSIPEGDGPKRDESLSDSNKSNDTKSPTSNRKPLDWREFRATLYHQEQAETASTGSHSQEGAHLKSKPLGLKWAHPISSPENGCVLIATDLLDGIRSFERTVVLLLSSGTRNPREGPFGIIINRPLHRKIKHMEPTNLNLRTTFADCSLHFGGVLETSTFLLRTREKTQLPGFEEVVPGLYFGSRNSLDQAAGLVKKGVLKPQDVKFFQGYVGWQFDQLRDEIESKGYWHIAACSTNLILGGLTDSSSERLWEEILQLMGGEFSELSRKPKQDM
jgi:putative transcriptional regulator